MTIVMVRGSYSRLRLQSRALRKTLTSLTLLTILNILRKNMKKVLLTAAAVAALSTSSAYAMEDVFYVKANVGWNKNTKISKLKSNNDVFFGIGAGYHIMDNFRAEIVFDHFVNPEHKWSGKDDDDSVTVKYKGNVNSLLLNGFVDLFQVNPFTIFAGAGVGVSQVSAKLKVSGYTGADADENGTWKLKQKYNLAFAGYVGAGFEFAPGVVGDITYSYRDHGKPKKVEGAKANYKGHNVSAGVRFDI